MEADLEGKQRALGVCGPPVVFQKAPISCLAPVSLPIILELSSTTLPPAFSFSPHWKPVCAREVDMHELKLGRITTELTRGTGKMSLVAGKGEGMNMRERERERYCCKNLKRATA